MEHLDEELEQINQIKISKIFYQHIYIDNSSLLIRNFKENFN